MEFVSHNGTILVIAPRIEIARNIKKSQNTPKKLEKGRKTFNHNQKRSKTSETSKFYPAATELQ